MSPKTIYFIGIIVIAGLIIAHIMRGDGSDLERQNRLLKLERDSLSLRNEEIEHSNDSVIKADERHVEQLDSAIKADTVIVIRENNRNDEHEELYMRLDTASRAERYEYFGTVLTTFNAKRP